MSETLALIAIAAALGLIVGMLGGGGGILAVPLLLAAGQPFLVASSQSLVIVGAGSLAALVPHHRAGRVDWRVGLTFGAIGAVGAVIGAKAAAYINPTILLGGLVVLLILGSVAMGRSALREYHRTHVEQRGFDAEVPETAGSASGDSPAGQSDQPRALYIVVLASAVGLVTGLLGVGAGFVVVPALVTAMRLPVKKATATALVVIVINSAVAATVRHESIGGSTVVVALAVASATFAVMGALLSRRVSGWTLSAAFAILMVLVATYTVIHAALSL